MFELLLTLLALQLLLLRMNVAMNLEIISPIERFVTVGTLMDLPFHMSPPLFSILIVFNRRFPLPGFSPHIPFFWWLLFWFSGCHLSRALSFRVGRCFLNNNRVNIRRGQTRYSANLKRGPLAGVVDDHPLVILEHVYDGHAEAGEHAVYGVITGQISHGGLLGTQDGPT